MRVWGVCIQHLGYEGTQHICPFTVLETTWRSWFHLSIILQREKKRDATLLENPDLNWHLCFEIWQLVSSRSKLVIIWQTSHYGLKASLLLFMKHLRPHFSFLQVLNLAQITKIKNEFEQWYWLNGVSGPWSKTWCEMQIQTHLKEFEQRTNFIPELDAFERNTFCSPRLHLLYLIKIKVKQ